ncbi:Calx-beta domain-containing protein [Chitinimonas lacunae]|uniref:Calx-beta domain-containing protein n=1 Tax=Chitinimonas lacunae TaxID=1963018 RepID=A0ABV8MPT0_9NEIS
MKPGRLLQLAFKPLTLAVALALPAMAAEPGHLLHPVAVNGFAETGRSAVRFDPETAFNLAPGTELIINVPGRGDYNVVFERAELHQNGDRTWIGFLKGYGSDYRTILTHGAGGTIGRVMTPQGMFDISTTSGNRFSILTDLKAAGLRPAPMDHDHELASLPSASGKEPPVVPANRFAATQEIDLMVLYSRTLRDKLGESAMQTQINNSIALANQAYIDSNVPMRVRLVHSQMVDYPESATNKTTLEALRQHLDAFANVGTKRKEVGADLVTYLRNYVPEIEPRCGLGYVIGSGNGGETKIASSQAFGFSVVNVGKAPDGSYCSDLTLAHELGHNMGSAHDRANSPNTKGAFPYSYGYGIEGSFGTVMSYINPEIGKFSSPHLDCRGQACGVSENDTLNAAHNALSLSKAAPYIAAFMPSTGTPIADPSKVQFLAATAQTVEGAGNLAIQIGRTGDTSKAASVQWSIANGTATSGRDINGPTSGTVSWAANDSAVKTIMIPIADDSEVEAAETFTVSLQNPSGAEIGSISRVTATITDNDTTPVDFILNPASITVGEGDGEVRFTVSLKGSHTHPVSVRYGIRSGTAKVGGDFENAGGTLSWAANDNGDKTVTVKLIEDEEVEQDETFYLDLSSPTGGQIKTGTSAVLIRDNDVVVEESIVEFDSVAVRTVEGQRKATLKVRRTGSSALSVRIATKDDTALAGGDYQSLDTVLSWADGDRDSRTIDIPVMDDSVPETEEKFSVTLSQADGGRVGKGATATVSVVDDDQAGSVTVGLDAQEYQVDEQAGVLRVGVKRNGSSVGAVSVKFLTASGTAFEGDDFNLVSQTLTWADGDAATKLIEVPIVNDQWVEGPENFELQLSEPTGASLGTDSARVTIKDDDQGTVGSISFDPITYSVDEQAGMVRLTLKRTGTDSAAAKVRVTTRAGSATEGTDFSAIDQMVVWADGDVTDKTVEIPVLDDGDAERNEQFEVLLSDPVGITLGTASVATVTVMDNDAQMGTVGFDASQYRVEESGKQARLTVRRNGSAAGAASVRVRTRAGSARDGVDYMTHDSILNWGDGDASPKWIDIGIADDTEKEGLESFSVELSEPTGVTLNGLQTAQVDIVDNDGGVCSQELCFDGLPRELVTHLDTLTFAVNLDWAKLQLRKIDAVDLWLAIRLGDGTVFFLQDVAGMTSFSLNPVPYRRTLTRGTGYVKALDNLPLSPELRGQYTFFALLMKSGAGLETFPGQAASQLRSQPVSVR